MKPVHVSCTYHVSDYGFYFSQSLHAVLFQLEGELMLEEAWIVPDDLEFRP